MLLTGTHGAKHSQATDRFQREGPFNNVLWFPQSYRRAGENRHAEGSLCGLPGIPRKPQLSKDLVYFKDVVTSRSSWSDALRYLIFRDLDDDWGKLELQLLASITAATVSERREADSCFGWN